MNESRGVIALILLPANRVVAKAFGLLKWIVEACVTVSMCDSVPLLFFQS